MNKYRKYMKEKADCKKKNVKTQHPYKDVT